MEKTNNDYSMIIIGAGITGLSTGLAWTKIYNTEKHPVLIIEKQPVPGGCVTTFAREGYRFDTVQIIPDVSDVLNFFGIDVELNKFENIYARLFLVNPETKHVRMFPVASEIQTFADYLGSHYPKDRKKISHFFEYCSKMHHELQFLKTEPKFHELFKILYHCPKILANSNKTYKQFLKKFRFSNPELIEILDIFSSFSGLSGNRCAALLTACAMITTLKGSYRPKKGFIQFPLMLQKAYEDRGGEIVFGKSIKKILTRNNTAVGVELDDGTRIRGEIVVSTADTKLTCNEMLGYDVLHNAGKKYALKVQNVRMSPSGMAIHIGLDDTIDLKQLGFDCGYSVLTTGRTTHERMFDEWEAGNMLLSDDQFHFGVIAPSVMTGGKPCLIIHVVPVSSHFWLEMREKNYDGYVKEKYRVADFFVSKVEEYLIPGLKNHIRYTDVSTPATYARYIGSTAGSNFDMMPVPGNFGKNRLRVRTPVQNLYLPKFSHGIWPSMQGGLQVVDLISHGRIMNGNASYFAH